MSKQTPKPWIITHQNGILPDEGLVGIAGPPTVNSHGHEVRMYVAQYVLPENAKLIVMVHELLEALESVIAESAVVSTNSKYDTIQISRGVLDDIRELIAKAKGET